MLTVTSAEADYVPLVEGQDKVLDISVQDDDGSYPDFTVSPWNEVGEIESYAWFRITDPSGKPDSVTGEIATLYQVSQQMVGDGTSSNPFIQFPTPAVPDNINVRILIVGSAVTSGITGAPSCEWFSSGGTNFSRKAKPRLLAAELVIVKNGGNNPFAEFTEGGTSYELGPVTSFAGQHFLTTQIMIEFRQSPLAKIAT